MQQKKLTFVISGPSGVGKGTICERLVRELDGIALSVSCTTRAPRALKDGGMEIDGVHYHFISREKFSDMAAMGDFYEYAQVHDNFYGTSRSFVEKQKQDGSDVILEIDMQGALQVKAADPQAVTIFVLPPSFEALRSRLIGRHSETPEQVQKRLADASEQLSYAYAYDYVIVNDDLDAAVEDAKAIVRAARHATFCCKNAVDSIRNFCQEVK